MRPKKHSLTLRGHRTSVSLEAEFWQAFRDIAKAEGETINGLAARIDAERGTDAGLASAIRIFVLEYYRHERIWRKNTAGFAKTKDVSL